MVSVEVLVRGFQIADWFCICWKLPPLKACSKHAQGSRVTDQSFGAFVCFFAIRLRCWQLLLLLLSLLLMLLLLLVSNGLAVAMVGRTFLRGILPQPRRPICNYYRSLVLRQRKQQEEDYHHHNNINHHDRPYHHSTNSNSNSSSCSSNNNSWSSNNTATAPAAGTSTGTKASTSGTSTTANVY